MSFPFRKIFIANRGEIVLRIIRAARELGLSTTGIYSEADRHSGWVGQNNDAYPLGDGPIADTYLNIKKIISLARQSGADAIHPGYGFLSENHHFAEACAANHITFIGPDAGVLKLMGNKLAAHEFVQRLGVHVPGRITGTAHDLLLLQNKLKYPVLVKAIAGGGGKGMRLVNHSRELENVLTTTSSEALHYFGDDRVYIEDYLHSPRHIEVQIMGDSQGNIVHLFERECSIQRRHQKIIEEAPAVLLPENVRSDIIQAALLIARELHYCNAGTVEFLLDENGKFYFLEMNPRIQVEHGITEMITGIDIVKEQITVAAGSSLSFDQKSIHYTGHAIEARIYAEDAENDLLPCPGPVNFYRQPNMADIRIDTAVSSGTVLPGEYDPLIAKVLVHAPSRKLAIARLRQTVDNFVITGVKHNLPLIKAILHEEDYAKNRISTTYLNEKQAGITSAIAGQRKKTNELSLIIAAAHHVVYRKPGVHSSSPWHNGYWRNVKQIRFRLASLIFELDYSFTGDSDMVFYHNQIAYTVNVTTSDDHQISFLLNGEKQNWYPLPEKDGTLVISDGHLEYCVERFIGREYTDNETKGEILTGYQDTIFAPLPGTVLRIGVTTGQQVNPGDNLLTIESMKLENAVLATCSALVKRVAIKTGDKVKKDEPLIHFQQITHKLN